MPTCTAFGVKSRISVPSSMLPRLCLPPPQPEASANAPTIAMRRARRTDRSLAYHPRRCTSDPREDLGGTVEARSASGAVTTRREDVGDDLRRRGFDAYAAELIGTLLLVFFIGTIVSLHSPVPEALGVTDWAVIGLLHFLLLTMLVYTLGQASGAHFNPAVTVTLA